MDDLIGRIRRKAEKHAELNRRCQLAVENLTLIDIMRSSNRELDDVERIRANINKLLSKMENEVMKELRSLGFDFKPTRSERPSPIGVVVKEEVPGARTTNDVLDEQTASTSPEALAADQVVAWGEKMVGTGWKLRVDGIPVDPEGIAWKHAISTLFSDSAKVKGMARMDQSKVESDSTPSGEDPSERLHYGPFEP